MSYALFLDDVRFPRDVKWVDLPPRDWVIVRSYDEFVKKIQERGLPHTISFDHDLCIEDVMRSMNFKEKTGMDCAKWLVDYCEANGYDIPDYTVHSLNPHGCENIKSYLESYKRSKKL